MLRFLRGLVRGVWPKGKRAAVEPRQSGLSYDEMKSVALLTVALLVAAVLVVLFLWRTAEVVLVFYVSVVLSHAVEPVVGFGEKYRIPRIVTIVAVYVLILLVFGFVLFLVIPPLITQLTILAETLPDRFQELELFLQNIRLVTAGSQTAAILEETARRLGQELITWADALVVLPLRLTEVILILFTIPIVSFYWLVNSVQIEATFLSLLPEARRAEAQDILAAMARKTGGYIRGEAIAMSLVALLSYIGLSLLGVNFALILALLAGVLEIVPYVGPPLAAIPAVIVAFLDSPILALEVVVLYVVVQQVESNVIMPNVMHREVGLHPLIVIAAIWIGGSILGFLGAILAIPASASLEVLFQRVVFPWVRSWRW